MSTLIIGGGASGVYAALLIKKKKPQEEVFLLDKEDKMARKMYATGNGHCNLLNKRLEPRFYSHPEFMGPLLKKYDYAFLRSLLENWGIALHEEGDLVYPESYNAGSYVSFLLELLRKSGVHFILGRALKGYDKKDGGFAVKFADGESYPTLFDRVVIAVGGVSSPNLGSDGSFYPCLREHGYHLLSPEPGLAPLKLFSSSSLKPLAGYRHEAKVTLLDATGKSLYEEEGEILYKDDGISGIVIFNVESVYCRLHRPNDAALALDYFPHEKSDELSSRLLSSYRVNPSFFLSSYFPEAMVSHLLQALGLKNAALFKEEDIARLVSLLKNERYRIQGPYDFKNSQVTIGGVSLDDLTPSLASKIEKGVAFAGEIVDIDGACGGYNLSWSLLSAFLASEVL
jgi:predicted Rossmann fold flavoprotein